MTPSDPTDLQGQCDLADAGVARVSWRLFLYLDAMAALPNSSRR
jgi:hypothetical protein